MQILVLFLSTSLIFLIADAVMLTFVLQPLFKTHLGAGLAENLRLLPAILFYISYMAGVMWFASYPALKAGTPSAALLNGAILGFIAYGCYELTSWTVMRDWHPAMVGADMAWGTLATALSAWAGVMITRALTA